MMINEMKYRKSLLESFGLFSSRKKIQVVVLALLCVN